MAEFKDRVKELRLEKNYSMGDVVEHINKKYGTKLTTSHISRYENGERTPSIVIASYFAKFYGVTLDYLVGLVDNPEENNGPDYILHSSAVENVFAGSSPGRRQVVAKKRKEGNVG